MSTTNSFLFCMVVLLLLSLSFIETSGNYASPSPINLTLVDERTSSSKQAICLDGSRPGYHFDKGFDFGVNNWIVFLEGGAWCSTAQECYYRTPYPVGSSSKMQPINFTGILDIAEANNPDFFNWNKVYVRYCDGSSFMGDVEKVDPFRQLHYRGASIFEAVMEELLAKGMKNASNAILTGCSAGSLATILHCDGFRSLFPDAARVKCISDGGFFIHAKDLPGAKKREDVFGGVVELHGLAKTLPSSCTTRMDPHLCLFPENLVGDVQTPLFLLNSALDVYQIQKLEPPLEDQPGWTNCTNTTGNLNLCTPSQWKLIEDFKTSFLQTVKEIGNSTSRGMLIHSCYTHCHNDNGTIWENFGMLKSQTLVKVIGDWYFDRNSYQVIDNNTLTPQYCSNIY